MGSSTVLTNGHSTDVGEFVDGQKQELDVSDNKSTAVAIPRHPLGIKPAGNMYTATYNLKSAAGSFVCLPDEVIVAILEYLDAQSLLRLDATCKALYAFARFEDLWKTLFIEYVQNTLLRALYFIVFFRSFQGTGHAGGSSYGTRPYEELHKWIGCDGPGPVACVGPGSDPQLALSEFAAVARSNSSQCR